ncbi:MAG: hypothetical protein FJX76_19190 [Armatimonadetes bacterium]|nr:hypothetical protein [Armatimonadota bacterium]
MALSRREFQLLQDRVSKLESQVRSLETKFQVFEKNYKGDNLLRLLKEAEEQEKARKDRESIL